jgi:hypothetical protein
VRVLEDGVTGGIVGGSGGSSDPALVVVWADPGITTGWSVHRVSIPVLLARGQVAATSVTWSRVGQYRSGDTSSAVDSYLNLCRAVWEKSDDSDVVVLGCEGFRLMMNSTDEALLEPVRFLAILRDRLRGTGVGVEVQYPAERSVITDERLRLWGLWHPALVHGRDAQKHGLAFLRRFAGQEALRKRVGWGG